MSTDYLCEQKLQQTDPMLHRRFTDSVFGLQNFLTKYKNFFPTYTDHTELHSMNVIDFCNALIGEKNIQLLNPDEIYILLMGCYLHDTGMGVSEADYEVFRKKPELADSVKIQGKEPVPEVIRKFHHEFSGLFIQKYAEFFDIPSEEYIFAIVQVARGHRKTDLYDEQEYPSEYKLPNGNTVCLPYLAALIRLADEIDIAADRNLKFLYNIDEIDNEISKMEFRKHEAIRHLEVRDDAFVLHIDASDQLVYEAIQKLEVKLDETLQYCRKVVEERTPYRISQERIEEKILTQEKNN